MPLFLFCFSLLVIELQGYYINQQYNIIGSTNEYKISLFIYYGVSNNACRHIFGWESSDVVMNLKILMQNE